MPFKLKFHEGEKVLCFHGPLIYEAKVKKVLYSEALLGDAVSVCSQCLKTPVAKEKDKTLKYQIHYNGWNKRYDLCLGQTDKQNDRLEREGRQKQVDRQTGSLVLCCHLVFRIFF